jgi:hypothetical protein
VSGPTRRKRQRRAPGQRREGDLPALFPVRWFAWPSLVIDCVLVTLLLFLRAGNLDLPGYRLAFVALMSRPRRVPALVTVDDAAWRGWRRAS